MRSFLLALLNLLVVFNLDASDIKDVLPLTNKIIWIHFDDGSVTYPNTLNVNRLDVTAATMTSSWTLSSEDDGEFFITQTPLQAGRKSKGTEFKKDPETWGGSSYNPTTKPWASEHEIFLILPKPMKTGKTYKLSSGSLAKNGSEWIFTFDETQMRSEAVHVNTLGYASDAPKYGYIYQWMGDLGGLNLSEYASAKFRIHMEGNSTPVKEGIIRKRKSATNAETSQASDTPGKNFLGAEVYDCDFSDITADGTYYLVIEGIGRSYPFKIGADAVFDAYFNVMRGLYHQRSGIRLAPPYTQADYIRPVNQNTKVTSDDGTSFAGKLLYSDYPFTSWENSDGGGTSQAAIRTAATGKTLDVAGWYHDAGDWDQYYTHERIPIILMLSYELAPDRFCDADLNLPESGNGIPDIIDEASWLIKFNYRLRKELIAKGYSNGGVGGARICADVYTDIDGSAESSLPSWKETRHTIITQADAFMTYLYAGQASQFAMILKKLGKNPAKFPVEMLDNADFASMSHDTVNWTSEAEEAFAWASKPENQPDGKTNYSNDLKIYRLYAAVNLFRITGNENYHSVAKTILNELKTTSGLNEDERWGVYSYLIANNQNIDKVLQSELLTVTLNTADNMFANAVEKRACRWGGLFDMPMLVGQGTTPWVLEALVAYELSGNLKYKNAIHTTADYFLGTNPRHTTWMTGVGPRPAVCGFHLDSRYNHNWVLYPGFIPYGPWSMAYGTPAFTWTVDGVSVLGGMGPWDKDWANFSQYPLMNLWPGHERWNSNIHSPMSSENTIHQNTVYGGIAYGFVNSRHHTNSESLKKIATLTLGNSDILLDTQGKDTLLMASADISDATFAALKWKSSDPRLAFVDDFGRLTGLNSGTCMISVSTLDESTITSFNVTCSWLEVNVEQIKIDPDTLTLIEGQKKNLAVSFTPANASNKYINWSFSQEGIVSIDENNILTALSEGNVMAIARSLNNDKLDTCFITIKQAVDYIISDFDSVIPVTTAPQAELAQIYTPTGSNDTAYNNPLIGDPNTSSKVVKWNRPTGDWKLLGIVLPLNYPQDLTQYAQFQFKYYGAGVTDFYIQLIMEDETQIEINESVDGQNCWQLFSYNLTLNKRLVQFNIFANSQGNPLAIPILFDDFKLAGKPSERFDGITISEVSLEMNSEETLKLIADAQGHPFTWISTDPEVVIVDQAGKITAVSGGTAFIKAVPLFGNSIECKVAVDGGVPAGLITELITDFETITLDWTAGYGAFAWASNSVLKTDNPLKYSANESDKTLEWDRDGTNNWGGFGLQFPLHNTTGFEYISFQVSATGTVNTIRIKVFNGDISLGFYQLDNLGIQAGKWATVSFSLTDLGLTNKDFNKIQLQIAGGSAAVMQVYVDNIMLKSPGEIYANSITINETGPILIYTSEPRFQLTATILPANAFSQGVDWSSGNSEVAGIGITGLVHLKSPGTTYLFASLNQYPSLKDSIRIEVSPPVGLIKSQNKEIRIYPNPFNETIIFSDMEGIVKISVTNVLGSIVKETLTNGNSLISIQTNDLPKGIYCIQLYETSGYRATKKIIKK